MKAGLHNIQVARRLMMIAWWSRGGLQMRPISAEALTTMLPEVQSNHQLQFDLLPAKIPLLVLLYVLRTNYMPLDKAADLGLTGAGVAFLRESVGHFIEDHAALSPKHRAALDVIWQRVRVRDVYPYDAHRKFRDCRAREVFDSMHELRLEFDVITQKWIEHPKEQS